MGKKYLKEFFLIIKVIWKKKKNSEFLARSADHLAFPPILNFQFTTLLICYNNAALLNVRPAGQIRPFHPARMHMAGNKTIKNERRNQQTYIDDGLIRWRLHRMPKKKLFITYVRHFDDVNDWLLWRVQIHDVQKCTRNGQVFELNEFYRRK